MTAARKGWARKQGEAVARRFGCTNLPVDPFAIVREEDIRIGTLSQAGKGVSGVFHIQGHEAAILYRACPNNPGYERFSVAHELGHYFLDGHPEMISREGGEHHSRAGFMTKKTAIEVEADHFAAGLLMPSALVHAVLADGPVGLEAIMRLKLEAQVSVRAAAISYAQQADHPVAILVSCGDRIQYAFLSASFRRLGGLTYPRRNDPLPAGMTAAFNADPQNAAKALRICGRSTLRDWCDGGGDVDLDEEVLGLGRSGSSLTVLSSEDLPRGEAEEDDERQGDRPWVPRFR